MSFQPVVPFGGYAGWKFLSRTIATQRAAFAKDPVIQRDSEYFRANIGKINSADELVNDRRLLGVALGAFGLDADINSKAFIRKVLQDGTLKDAALANRLSDKRYLELSKAFGFGDFPLPRNKISDFGPKITALYQQREFEAALGESDGDLRLAASLSRDLTALAGKSNTENTKWFTILGTASLRKVFQTAFNLPNSFGSINLDRQLQVFSRKAEQLFGDTSVSQFADPGKVEELVRLFLLRAETQSFSSQFPRGTSALTLLQNGQSKLRSNYDR